MADLPTIPLRVPQLTAPQSRVSPGQIAAPYQELAQNLDHIGETLNKDVAQPLAEKAGYQSVTTDADGNLRVEKFPIVGEAADHYKRTMKIAAVAEAEGNARRDDIALRQEHHDDPEGYRLAADAYTKAKVKQFTSVAGPEVGIAIGRSIEQATTTTYKGLLNEKERLDLARAHASITSEIATAQNEQYALAAQGDTSSPEFEQRTAKIHALYGEMVSNPRLAFPRERADAEMAQWESQLRASGIAGTLSTSVYNERGYEGAMKEAERIRSDPSLALTPQQREAFYSKAVTAINARARAGEAVVKNIATEIGDINKIASEGYTPTPDRIANLKQIVAQSKDPWAAAQLDRMLEELPIVANWRQMSPQRLEGELNNLGRRLREGGADERSMALLHTGDKLLGTMRKELAADPLGWAGRAGVMEAPAINFGSPAQAAEMRARVGAAEMIAREYGTAPTYLHPEEVRALAVATAAGGEPMLGLARDIADGFGDRSGRVLSEVSKEAPVLAHVGGLLSGGLFGSGSKGFSQDVAEALKLRADKEFKLPRWLDHPTDKILTSQNAETRKAYGDAFTLAPDTGRAAEAATQAAFFARANRNGYTPILEESSDSKTAYSRALQEAAGATFAADGKQFGGVVDYGTKPGTWFDKNKVLVRGDIRSDRFRDVIRAVTDDDLSKLPISPVSSGGQPYTARDLQGAVPVAATGGYRFAIGDPASDNPRWIRGADGKPFVLNLDAIGDLPRRVPGAFIGTR